MKKLVKCLEEVIDTLPEGFEYRIIYDQSAKYGKWRIIAIDKQYRDVFGAAGSTIDEAKLNLEAVHKEGLSWILFDSKD